MSSASRREHRGSDFPWFMLLALLAATVLLQTIHQTLRLRGDAATLEALYAAQQTPLDDVARVRTQLESLAGQTAVLAETGNANARLLQTQLQAQGIAIRPPRVP